MGRDPTQGDSVTTELSADYVIVGTGAVGMAFADVIVSESDATLIMIDRYAKPGGHWNVAYPFVQLHQPASFYGVSSMELSNGRHESGGFNDGLEELSSGPAVAAYFDEVMRHHLLPSGRVQYFPMCDYTGDGTFVSKVTGERFHATAHRKTVDCTHLNTSVPSTHTPNFAIDDRVRFMPLNDLPTITERPDRYVVIGAGKTGIDACLWLLTNGVDPTDITWIKNRDAWLIDRRNAQMTAPFFFDTMGAQVGMMRSIVDADDPDDMFWRLEACGYFVRIFDDVEPEMFHAATISRPEIDALRQIEDVVRLGYVTEIGPDRITLERGTVPTTPNTVHIDCSARAVPNNTTKPIFEEGLITPQMTRPYQPAFSAALIAHVELNYDTDVDLNRLCGVVPLPNAREDFIRFSAAGMMNQYQWSLDRDLSSWISSNRLDGASKLIATIAPDETDKAQLMLDLRDLAPQAAMKLFGWVAELDAAEG
ncbi:MAG: NAD(P)/FAD-dependent oxidoreductase [Actinomycetota bacterium]